MVYRITWAVYMPGYADQNAFLRVRLPSITGIYCKAHYTKLLRTIFWLIAMKTLPPQMAFEYDGGMGGGGGVASDDVTLVLKLRCQGPNQGVVQCKLYESLDLTNKYVSSTYLRFTSTSTPSPYFQACSVRIVVTYAYNIHAVRTHSTDRTVSYSSRTHHIYDIYAFIILCL